MEMLGVNLLNPNLNVRAKCWEHTQMTKLSTILLRKKSPLKQQQMSSEQWAVSEKSVFKSYQVEIRGGTLILGTPCNLQSGNPAAICTLDCWIWMHVVGLSWKTTNLLLRSILWRSDQEDLWGQNDFSLLWVFTSLYWIFLCLVLLPPPPPGLQPELHLLRW